MRPNLARHWQAVRNVTLPGTRVPFRLGPTQVGWVQPEAAARLRRHGARDLSGGVTLETADALPSLAHTLAQEGAFPWRGEAFDVREQPGAPALTTIDRGALPWFGIGAEGVHVNGLVRRADGVHLWVARRAANRLMDPGKLDHIIAGGIPAGLTPADTLLKEGAEEARLPPEILRTARPAGTVRYITERPEGLRRDCLHGYDLWLPEGMTPVPGDGEVAAFELWPLARVRDVLEGTDDFKFNVALVITELLGRQGLLF